MVGETSFSSACFDAQMVSLSEADDAMIEMNVERKEEVIRHLIDMFRNNATFASSVQEATNTPSRIRYRIQQLQLMLLW